MTHDWVLVETLGAEPAVVARGRQSQNLVPVRTFLRRDPNLMAIQTAIAETVAAGQGLISITPKSDRVIRTEVVQMTDGRIHGVHVWTGPPDADPPERPIPGPLKWDLTSAIATDTRQSLLNSGVGVDEERPQGRPLFAGPADDEPGSTAGGIVTAAAGIGSGAPTGVEAGASRPTATPEPGKTFCGTWDVTDCRGNPITVGYVARTLVEEYDDGTDHTVCRAMNWRSEHNGPMVPVDQVVQRIIDGLMQSRAQRALVDTHDWSLLKWLDAPPEFLDWRTEDTGLALVNPDDAFHVARMTVELADGVATGILRLRTMGGGWTPVHVTIDRVELESDSSAGLVSLRTPTPDELSAAGLESASVATVKNRRSPRRGRARRRRSGDR